MGAPHKGVIHRINIFGKRMAVWLDRGSKNPDGIIDCHDIYRLQKFSIYFKK